VATTELPFEMDEAVPLIVPAWPVIDTDEIFGPLA